MGMLDRMKDVRQQAKDALAGVSTIPGMPTGMPTGMPSNMDEQLRYRDLVQKLKVSGVDAPAVINAIRRGQADPITGSVSTELDITIKPPQGDAYPATVKQAMLPAWLDTLSQGSPVSVKYDPDSPTSAIIYGDL
jgi:hypothetical protein